MGDGADSRVRELRPAPGGKLFAGGEFTITNIGFNLPEKVAFWNRQEWYPLGGNTDGVTGGTLVHGIAATSKNRIFIGGNFTVKRQTRDRDPRSD